MKGIHPIVVRNRQITALESKLKTALRHQETIAKIARDIEVNRDYLRELLERARQYVYLQDTGSATRLSVEIEAALRR